MEEVKTAEQALTTIAYFKEKYLNNTNILYELKDNTLKFKVSKELYGPLTATLKKEKRKFDIDFQTKKLTMRFPIHDGKKLQRTKPFDFEIFFVEDSALDPIEITKELTEKNIKNWSDFFSEISPEYLNAIKTIIDSIPIATHRDEKGKIVSKKTYWLDPAQGLYEKKEKLINEQYMVFYQPVTTNLYQVFRMFFKFYDEIPLNELANFDKFKEIIANTKYSNMI